MNSYEFEGVWVTKLAKFHGFGIIDNSLLVRQMPLMYGIRATLPSFTALKKRREEEEIAI